MIYDLEVFNYYEPPYLAHICFIWYKGTSLTL